MPITTTDRQRVLSAGLVATGLALLGTIGILFFVTQSVIGLEGMRPVAAGLQEQQAMAAEHVRMYLFLSAGACVGAALLGVGIWRWPRKAS